MTTLRTARLVLRPFQPHDMQAVVAYRNDPHVARFQSWALPFTEDHFQQLVQPGRRLAETGWISWCVCDAHGVVGDIGLRVFGLDAEIGVSVARTAQGRGYGSEALERLDRHAFDNLGRQCLHAGVNPGNSQVVRLLERAGWQHGGTTPQGYWHRDHWDDEACYHLPRTGSVPTVSQFGHTRR